MRLRLAGPFAALLVSLGGCFSAQPTLHSGEAVVHGRVLVNGQPLGGGVIYVSPKNMPHATFRTSVNPDGTFIVRRCISGTVRFAVDTAGFVAAATEGSSEPPIKLPPI